MKVIKKRILELIQNKKIETKKSEYKTRLNPGEYPKIDYYNKDNFFNIFLISIICFTPKENNKIKNRINLFYAKIFLKTILLMDLIQILSSYKLCYIGLHYSKITLKIKGIGAKNIFGYDEPDNIFNRSYYPDKVYINGVLQDVVNYSYFFNLTDNKVELEWNQNINNTKNMFRRCYDITEFDFSEFNTSEVVDMWCMFFRCSSLTSLNLSNFDTSKVTDMSGMIQYCYSLTSVDLSSFDTSKVVSINAMFQKDYSLTVLNIPNFDISNVQCIYTMFEGCANLEYINLKNFNETSLVEGIYNDMFGGVPDNVVICINESNNQNKILPQIKNKTCYTIDCSNDWKSKQKKIINNTDECIDNCDNSTIYKYEYNGKCYDNCSNALNKKKQ